MHDPAFLKHIFTVGDFSTAELETILSRFRHVHFSKNDFFLQEGQTANLYWFIETGFARSYVTDTEGNDITTGFYTAKDVMIDWPSFFLRVPTRESIQALSDCNCWQVDYENFQQLFHSIRAFRERGRAILVGSYFSLKNHSIAMIADQAKDRYLRLLRERPEILQHVPLKHIATYLGITDTSLSRIRKEFSQNFLS
jgi:CRP-like cAMP-binding protein